MDAERTSAAPRSALQWLMMLFVALAFVAATAAATLPTVQSATLGTIALAGLGLALATYINTRIGALPAQRIGAQAQARRARFRTLLVGAVAAMFAVLVLGLLVRQQGALAECTELPWCGVSGVTTLHRGAAALLTALVATVALMAWLTFDDRRVKQAAALTVVLLAAQNLIGLAQVALASTTLTLPLGGTRLAHLAFGAGAWGALVALATYGLRLPWPNTGPAAPAAHSEAAQPSKFKDYVSLTKPGVISLLIFTTLVAMFITPEGVPSFGLVFWTMLGGWLMPAGAHAINCYFDRDIDILMGRTGRRPIPSGRIPAWHALALGITLGVVAFTILAVFVNMAAALLALAGYFYYVVIYTMWLKRSTMSNIVIGGGAGAFPPLIGWAAVTGGLTLPSLFLFIIIFYWTPPHFWALALIREKDYARAGVPMLPVVAGDAETKRQIVLYSVMMVVLSLLLTPFGVLGVPYLLMALVLGGIFLYYAIRLQREGTTASAWSLYKFSLLYLALLFTAMLIDRLAFA